MPVRLTLPLGLSLGLAGLALGGGLAWLPGIPPANAANPPVPAVAPATPPPTPGVTELPAAPGSGCPFARLGLSAPELSGGRLSDGLVRQWSRFQGWLLRHPGGWSEALLSGCYTIDMLLYMRSPKDFLGRRRAVMGPNFAALGRLIVGDYPEVARLIAEPQQRSTFLGRGRVMAERFPANFPLFLSDREVGGDGRHEALHAWLWQYVAQPAEARAGAARLQPLIAETVATLRETPGPLTKAAVAAPVRRLVVRFMVPVLFELEPSPAQVDALITLFHAESLTRNYIAAGMEPFALPSALLGDLNAEAARVRTWLGTSPLFAADSPAMAAAPAPREEMIDLMFSLLGVAAMGGTSNLLTNLLTLVPEDLAADLRDPAARLRVILEAARLDAPVNNVNVILPAARTFRVEGQALEFPAGTVVAASIGTASMDPTRFPAPQQFDPARPELAATALVFNSVGFDPAPKPEARRVCPGRTVALRLADDFLLAWRQVPRP
jgi:cytochrome P450